MILIVEDNSDDEALAIQTLRSNRIINEIVVTHDGIEALDYLFGTGVYAGRNFNVLPSVILLNLKLPRVDGIEVLRRLREDDGTTMSVFGLLRLTTSTARRE